MITTTELEQSKTVSMGEVMDVRFAATILGGNLNATSTRQPAITTGGDSEESALFIVLQHHSPKKRQGEHSGISKRREEDGLGAADERAAQRLAQDRNAAGSENRTHPSRKP